MTLEQLADWEVRLLAAVPERGYFEELIPIVEAADLDGSWLRIFTAYVERIDRDEPDREALCRAVFLAWYELNEPWPLTGIRNLPPAQVRRVLERLDQQLSRGDCDPELLAMLRGYGPGLPFDLYPELRALSTFMRSIEGAYSPDAPLRPMQGRGALGRYWSSRSDATYRKA